MSERDPWHDGHELWSGLRAWFDDAAARSGPAALDALSDISSLRRLLDRAELAAVAAARRAGQSWAEIATRLGVTRQSAWERWRDLDDAAPADPPEAQTLRAVESDVTGELVRDALRQRRRSSTVVVPDVTGLSLDDARSALAQRGLTALGSDPDGPPLAADGWPDGVVTDQSPESGAKVPNGSGVRLWLERGGGSGGVREPRRPTPGPSVLRAMRPEPTDHAVG